MNNPQNQKFSEKKLIIQITHSSKITNRTIFQNKITSKTNNSKQSQKNSKTTNAITYQRIISEDFPDTKNSIMNLSLQQFKEIVDAAVKNAVTKTIAKFISKSSNFFELANSAKQKKFSNLAEAVKKALMNESKK